MSEYKCPKCGGELEHVGYLPDFETNGWGCFACPEEGEDLRFWTSDYLQGYWTCDAERRMRTLGFVLSNLTEGEIRRALEAMCAGVLFRIVRIDDGGSAEMISVGTEGSG